MNEREALHNMFCGRGSKDPATKRTKSTHESEATARAVAAPREPPLQPPVAAALCAPVPPELAQRLGATADWLAQIASLRAEAPDLDPIAEGLTGFSVIAARAEEEAAGACALLQREAL